VTAPSSAARSLGLFRLRSINAGRVLCPEEMRRRAPSRRQPGWTGARAIPHDAASAIVKTRPREPGTKAASAGLSWCETAIPSPQFAIRKASFVHSRHDREGNGGLWSVPMRQRQGMIGMSVSRSKEAVRRHNASMARALAWLRAGSPGCDAPGSAFHTLSPVRVSSGPHRIPHGIKTTAASRLTIR
jgi:hypothetical protein